VDRLTAEGAQNAEEKEWFFFKHLCALCVLYDEKGTL
jgi:hypothetical protein